MYTEVDVLLTLEQFQQVVPDTLACYLSYGTLIRFERTSIPISHISGLSQIPHSMLEWNVSSQSLLHVSREVGVFYSVIGLVKALISVGFCSLF